MKKITTLILTLALLITSIFTLASCKDDPALTDLEQIKADGKIVIGVTVYEPMDYLVEGEWTGFDAELAQMFAEKLGVKCQFVIINWDMKTAELNDGYIDLIWNGMTATDALDETIDFSVSYAKNAQVAVAKKNSGITASDVKNSEIAVEKGSAGATVAEEDIDAANINKVTAQVDALNEVAAGTSDVAIIDITMAQSVVGKGTYQELEIVSGASYGDEIFAVGLRTDSDIKAELDAFLKDLYADGTLAEPAEEYGVGLNTEALAD